VLRSLFRFDTSRSSLLLDLFLQRRQPRLPEAPNEFQRRQERALGLEVAKSDWPIHFMRWVTRLEPTGNKTQITQELEHKAKFGPLGLLHDPLVMRKKLKSTLDVVFAELVKQAEGRP
jgi:hypothetical protein